MKRTPDQPTISKDLEDSPNRSKRTGRNDGTGGGQKKSGVSGELNVNRTKSSGKDSDALRVNSQRGVDSAPLPEVTSLNGEEVGDRPGATRKIGAKEVR